MARVSRRVLTYKVTCYEVKVKGLEASFEPIAETFVDDVSMSMPRAKAAIRDAVGVTRLKANNVVQWEPVAYKTYAIPLDTFLKMAQLVEQGEIKTGKEPVEDE